MAPLLRYPNCHDFSHFTLLPGNLPPRLQKKVSRASGSALCLPEGHPLSRTSIVSEAIGNPLSPVVALVDSRVVSGAPVFRCVRGGNIATGFPHSVPPRGPGRRTVAGLHPPATFGTDPGGSGVRNRLTALGVVPLSVVRRFA